MHTLWSPWRSQYIKSFSDKPSGTGCFLCDAASCSAEHEQQALLLRRSEYSFAVMNMYPYNNGHVLVSPHRHVGELALLSEAEYADLFALVRKVSDAIYSVYKPHGLNMGANLGAAAGAGVPDHLHIHLVPRWNGDTSFMSSIAEAKVVSEHIEDGWRALREALSA